jgi:thiol-disulfide isomerase/thioredoxin
MKSEIKTAIILAVIIVGAVSSLSMYFSSLEKLKSPESETSKVGISSANLDKSNYKIAPDLTGISHYINTTPEELAKNMKGKVVLYDFWTYSCINCLRTLPYITAWSEKYANEGLLIIGIHSPEFEFEKDPNNVEMAVSKYGISYPVVMDNDMKTWNSFENRYWPRKYIADDEGYIRYDHIGEGEYEQTEKVIQELLKERSQHLGLKIEEAKPLVELKEFEQTSFRTPELYFGYSFVTGRNQLGNVEGFKPETDVKYSLPEDLQLHYYYLDGTWKNLKGSMKLVSEEGRIKLPFFAKEVNIVAANNAVLDILLDGKPISAEYAGTDVISGKVQTQDARLYNIIKTKEASTHTLEIIVNNPGFEVYTLTFG